MPVEPASLRVGRDGDGPADTRAGNVAVFDKRTDLTRLLAVAEAGRISWAADRLAITQPALTRIMLGWNASSVAACSNASPTDCALPRSERPSRDTRVASCASSMPRTPFMPRVRDATGAFRVTAGLMWRATVVAQAVGTFQEEFPAIEVRVETTTRVEGLRLLAAGEGDMHAGGIDHGEDLPPFRRLQAIMRETALGTLE